MIISKILRDTLNLASLTTRPMGFVHPYAQVKNIVSGVFFFFW
jgi:hypothetical protein